MLIDQLYQDYLRQLELRRELFLNEMMIKRAAMGSAGALSVLDSACRQVTGVPLESARRLSPERLQQLVQANGRSRLDSFFLAELLLEDVKLNEQLGEAGRAVVSRLQAFHLFAVTLPLLESKEQEACRKKLDILAVELEPLRGEPYVLSCLDNYRNL
jgi:hypothetical protein